MLLEIVLYFSLGFLAAVLLVLLIAPTIWNRAVILTTQRIKGALPLSLNEIQAERDRQRAEHAVTIRRLEMSMEELRQKATEQVIEVHSKRDEANRANRENRENLLKIDNLEKAAETMRCKLSANKERLEILELHSQELDALKLAYEELEHQNTEVSEELNRSKIELIASESREENLSATLTTINLPDDERTQQVKSLHEQITKLNRDLKEELGKSRKMNTALNSMAKKLAAAENRLAKQPVKRASSNSKETNLQLEISKLTDKLVNESAKVISLEAKLAESNLKNDSKEHIPETAKTVAQASKPTSSPKRRNTRQPSSNGSSTDDGEKLLREKIRKLAAKATDPGNKSQDRPAASVTRRTSGKKPTSTTAPRVETAQGSNTTNG
ncbi:MAG: hypothetical protein AAF423_11515 [Pseudomonadota bacterium]